MNTKSFRIRNYENELATVFPIGMGEFFTVAWDSEAPDTTVYSKKQIDEALANGYMVKLEEPSSEETLPRSFKYYHVDEGPELVNTWNDNGITVAFDGAELNYWGAKEAKSFIERGIWIVLPSDPIVNLPEGLSCETLEAYKEIVHNLVPSDAYEATLNNGERTFTEELVKDLSQWSGCMSYNDSYFGEPEGFLKRTVRQLAKEVDKKGQIEAGTLTFKIELDGIKEAQAALDGMVEQSNTTLERIKSFTEKHPAQVSILNGYYKVYDCEFDVEYTANSDEELLKILDSLLVLIEAANGF